MPVQLIAGSTLVLPSQPVPTTCMTTHKCAGAHTRRLRAKISSCRAVSIPFIRHVHRRCLTRSYSEGNSHMPSWAAETPTWNPSTRMQMNHLMDLFTIADKDGNGILDRQEVRYLLQSDARCTSGLCKLAQNHLISDDDLDEIMDQYDTDHKGGLSFSVFMDLILDGVLLDGSLDEYRAVFTAADADHDGALSATELAAALQTMTGEPVQQEDVNDIMTAAGIDVNNLIGFPEFLQLFCSKLVNVDNLLNYMKMKPQMSPQASVDQVTPEDSPNGPSSSSSGSGSSKTQAIPGTSGSSTTSSSSSSKSSSLLELGSEGDLNDLVLQLSAQTSLVVMFGLSGDAVCQTAAQALQDLAIAYPTTRFAIVHIDSSPEAKALFKQVLLGRYVPAFYLFRNGQLCQSYADSSVVTLEKYLRVTLPKCEQPEQSVFGFEKDAGCGVNLRQQQRDGSAAAAVDSEVEPYVVQGYSIADLVYDTL